jgi:hypothetical protein
MSDESKRFRIKWRKSRKLRERVTPMYRDYEGNVEAYLAEVVETARDVLADMGIDAGSPFGSYDLLKIFNRERNDPSADGFVAVRLFENATIARDLLKTEAPTANELRFAVVAMAEIADLLHIADIRAVTRRLSTADNTARDKEIRRRRYSGESFKTIRKTMKLELSDRQLARIAPKRKSDQR